MKYDLDRTAFELPKWSRWALVATGILGLFGLLIWPRAAVMLLCSLFVAYFILSYRQLLRMTEIIRHFQSTMSEFDVLDGKEADTSDRYRVLSELDDMLDRLKQFMDNRQTEQILRTQAEIHSLQSQINPHFLYNTLDTIRFHALRAGAVEVAEMTEALSLQFRYSISRPGKLSTFAEEMDNVASYLLIQRYRFGGKYRLLLLYDKKDPALMHCSMPVMTMQPLIENAIHHGLEPKRGSGTIRIRCEVRRTRIYIEVSDDGVGIDEERLAQLRSGLLTHTPFSGGRGTGIALINVDQRIRFYFGEDFGLNVFSKEGEGTQVLLTLPRPGQSAKEELE